MAYGGWFPPHIGVFRHNNAPKLHVNKHRLKYLEFTHFSSSVMCTSLVKGVFLISQNKLQLFHAQKKHIHTTYLYTTQFAYINYIQFILAIYHHCF